LNNICAKLLAGTPPEWLIRIRVLRWFNHNVRKYVSLKLTVPVVTAGISRRLTRGAKGEKMYMKLRLENLKGRRRDRSVRWRKRRWDSNTKI